MSWRPGRANAPVTIRQRWVQAHDEREVELDPFTQAELDCVTLDLDAVPADQRGPALQSVSPLLAQLAAGRPGVDEAAAGMISEAEQAAGPGWEQAAGVLADAAAALEERGYLRPGPPAASPNVIKDELSGWSAGPRGKPGPRPVTISGDLGIISRMRSAPYWIAEALTSTEPRRTDPAGARWRLVARMYAAFRPQGALVELPPGPDGVLPPYGLLWEHRAVLALVAWCGIDLADLQDPATRAATEMVPDVPTAKVADTFERVDCLRIAHPLGERVLMRTLVTATGGGRHWLLEDAGAVRAVRVSIDQTGDRIDQLIEPPAATATDGSGPPGGPDMSAGPDLWGPPDPAGDTGQPGRQAPGGDGR